MRVTLVVNRHGAVSETFQRSLAVVLADAGHQVTVHALRAGSGPTPDLPGVATTTALPALRARTAPEALARLVRGPEHAMASAARRAASRFGVSGRAVRAAVQAGAILESRPDVVHLGFSGLGVAMADALDLLDDPLLVVSCRGTDELVRPFLDEQRARDLGVLLRRVDLVHAVAGAVRDVVVGFGAPADQVRVIRPAIDLDRWTPRPSAPTHDHLALVAVARLQATKGIEDLLAAIAEVRAEGIDARLRVVGDGPHGNLLRLRIAGSGLTDAVTLVGALPSAEVRSEVIQADAFVSASLSEGISNGVLEAMASAVPVVSTLVGGMAEVLTDGVDGWLVPAARPDALAEVLRTLHADPGARARVAAAGRARVETGFGLERQRSEWVALYGELGRRRGQGSSSRSDRGEGS